MALRRLPFLSTIARTLQKAIHNAGGFLRRLIETPDYRSFITQADEDTAEQWLGASERVPQPVPIAEPEKIVQPLSNDALTVQVLLQDLKQVRYRGHPLALIQREGYLSDLDPRTLGPGDVRTGGCPPTCPVTAVRPWPGGGWDGHRSTS